MVANCPVKAQQHQQQHSSPAASQRDEEEEQSRATPLWKPGANDWGTLWGFSLEHCWQKELPQVLFIEQQRRIHDRGPGAMCCSKERWQTLPLWKLLSSLLCCFPALNKCLSFGMKQSDSRLVQSCSRRRYQVLVWTDLTWRVPLLPEPFHDNETEIFLLSNSPSDCTHAGCVTSCSEWPKAPDRAWLIYRFADIW